MPICSHHNEDWLDCDKHDDPDVYCAMSRCINCYVITYRDCEKPDGEL